MVLVQNVVGDTAEQVASHSARQEAAELAALVLQQRWQAEAPTDQDAEAPTDQDDADRINRAYSARCRQLGIIYSDIELRPIAKDGLLDTSGSGSGWYGNGPTCAMV